MNLKEIYREKLKTTLKERRYKHTLGVAETAVKMAEKFGCDKVKAETAALLHDCAKYMSSDTILNKCTEFGIPITDSERNNPHLLHAKLGAYYAEKEYGVEDQEILEAIRNHTTGRAEMTLLEKIIFTADYIEPGRKDIEKLDFIRKTAYENLDKAVFLILKNTIKYLKSWNAEIDKPTLEAYNYYRNFK